MLHKMIRLILLVIISRYAIFCNAIICNSSFPAAQLDALEDFYTSTNGKFWIWKDTAVAGAIWNFTSDANPCVDRWQGINCTISCMVKSIYLPSYNLTGTLTESLNQLGTMEVFAAQNNALYGDFPTLSNWTKLQYIDIQYNFIDGTFPSFITSSWLQLRTLGFANNHFHGSLPDTFNHLLQLNELNLESNQFTGTFPSSIASMPSLSYLYLNNNLFNGSIPQSIGDLKNLLVLMISNNRFTGCIPSSWTWLKELQIFDISNNGFSSSIPVGMNNLTSLQQFAINSNRITGSIPSFSALKDLILFRIDNNLIESTLPNCFHQLINITVFNATNNKLYGSLPQSLEYTTNMISFDVSLNHFSGSIGKIFSFAPFLQQLILFTNRFTGNVHQLVSPNTQHALNSIDLSNNRFSSSLPDSIFQVKNLTIFASAKNCFTGKLSAGICMANQTLQTLVLDGLHTQDVCQDPIFYHTHTYFITNPVTGTIPSCLLQDMSKLEFLHLSGNGLSGSLKNVRISSVLKTLSLAHNRLTGTIPTFFQSHEWEVLDLSFNKLNGYLSNDIYSFKLSNSSLHLENNRISGGFPSNLLNAIHINVLVGNMFRCDNGRLPLPSNDPHESSYQCGSDLTNNSLFTWIALLITISLVYYSDVIVFRCHSMHNQYLQRYKYVQQELNKWFQVFTQFDPKYRNLYEFGLNLKEMRRWSVLMAVMLAAFFIPLYGILTYFYGTYYQQYAWTISIAYLSGLIPTLVLLGFLMCLLLIVYSPLQKNVNLNIYNVRDQIQQHMVDVIQKHAESQHESQDNDEEQIRDQSEASVKTDEGAFREAQNGEITALGIDDLALVALDPDSAELQPVKFTADDAKSYYRWYALLGSIVVLNISVVIFVNSAYVYAISSNRVNIYYQQALSAALSLYKLIWNGSVMDFMYYFLHKRLRIKPGITHADILAKRSLLLPLMLWLSIFNSIIVPFIAVAVVSTNCYQFAIYPSDPVTSTIPFNDCTETVEPLPARDGYYTILNCNNQPQPYTIEYTPPFEYSFQCTSTLLASFMDIFMYRFILGGVVVPLCLLTLKFIQEYVLKKFGYDSDIFHLLSIVMPPELRPIGHVLNESTTRESSPSEDSKQSVLPTPSVDSSTSGIFDAFQPVKLKDINKTLGLSAPGADTSFGLYSSMIIFATDIAILLTFGTLFPPLAIVGCFTIFVRTIHMQIGLGRLAFLSNEQPSLIKLTKSLNDECVGISNLLMNCVLALPLLLSIAWSWFLFDIWGDVTGYNPAYTIFFCLPSIPLLFLPLVFPAIQSYILKRKKTIVQSAPTSPSNDPKDRKESTSMNPMVTNDQL